ncbi:MAG: hypothetical protein KME47_07560, partial [Nodosilinea sp. WJT8-NPBG4]|nr:hypothetical protein [Nodosilinea sp. WJT8-NPBG4]
VASVNSSKRFFAQIITISGWHRYSSNSPTLLECPIYAFICNIKNEFKESPKSAAEVFRLLTAQGAVTLVENKVSYNDKKIQELANQL